METAQNNKEVKKTNNGDVEQPQQRQPKANSSTAQPRHPSTTSNIDKAMQRNDTNDREKLPRIGEPVMWGSILMQSLKSMSKLRQDTASNSIPSRHPYFCDTRLD